GFRVLLRRLRAGGEGKTDKRQNEKPAWSRPPSRLETYKGHVTYPPTGPSHLTSTSMRFQRSAPTGSSGSTRGSRLLPRRNSRPVCASNAHPDRTTFMLQIDRRWSG